MFKYLIAFVLIMHGLAHLSGFLEAWTPVQAFAGRPWLFSEGVTMNTAVGRIFGLLWLVAAAGLAGAGYGLLAGHDWWPLLAVVAACFSLVVIVPWWRTVPPGARFGALFDLVIVVALLLPWSDRLISFLR